MLLSPTTRGMQLGRFKKTVEIRNEQGQLVHNWVLAGDELTDIAWSGANADGVTLPAGRYEVVYILSGEHGPLAWLRQPVELQD